MANPNISIHLTHAELNEKRCREFVTENGTGGVVVFVGTVRDTTNNKKVLALDFEAYEPMAQNEMDKIAQQAIDRWPLQRVAIHHRYGKLEVGEVAVVIAVSSAHRKETFEACEFCIDTLKQTVPIWKKEIFEDGEVWVSAHP